MLFCFALKAEDTNDILFFRSDDKQEIINKIESKYELSVLHKNNFDIKLAGRLLLKDTLFQSDFSVTPYSVIKIQY